MLHFMFGLSTALLLPAHVSKVPSPPRHPAIIALLSTSSSSAKSSGTRTAAGRRTEIDGTPAGQGGLGAALFRERWAKSLPRPPREVLELLDDKFSKAYDPVEINALWAQVKTCYGTEARAIEAVTRQPFLLNPTYTWPPPLLVRSKEALVEVLGSEEEALEVMRKNPAVLQCGAPGLLELGGDEIKLFANLRYGFSQVPPQTGAALGIGFGALLLLTTVGSASGGEALAPLLGVSKPLLGLIFAAAIEGSRIVIVGAVVQGQARKREASSEVVEQQKAKVKKIRSSAGGWGKLASNIVSGVLPGAKP